MLYWIDIRGLFCEIVMVVVVVVGHFPHYQLRRRHAYIDTNSPKSPGEKRYQAIYHVIVFATIHDSFGGSARQMRRTVVADLDIN